MGRLVMLRHGESAANADDVFAGWLDVPLTPRGIDEACAVGRELAGLGPDQVHTSVLARAIDTAHLVVTSAGWQVSLQRDWRLNERHYGALQGLRKAAARRRYGRDDVEQWRRSVAVAPPPVRPEVLAQQQADDRYAAIPEARTVAAESLADVAARMSPYWSDVLGPQLDAGRTVLVVAHGTSLRALLHLAGGVPLAETAVEEIPTAVPIMPRLRTPTR